MIGLGRIKFTVNLLINKIVWKLRNSHNYTTVVNVFNLSIVDVGIGTYGPLKVMSSGNQGKLRIGSWCSIASEVSFVLNNEHRTDTFSTYPWMAKVLDNGPEALSKGGITIGDGVWIGYRATVLDGVKIGDGAVVAAGALVSSDVPPYAIVVGVPARVLRYRFPEKVREMLLAIDYSCIDKEFVRLHIRELYNPLNAELAESLRDDLEHVKRG